MKNTRNHKEKAFTLTSLIVFAAIALTPEAVFATSFKDKLKCVIEDAADYLNHKVEATAEGIAAAQEYFDHYAWKGLIQNSATEGAATLSDVRMNGSHRAVVVRPGERIEGKVHCYLNPHVSSSLSYYRLVLGFPVLGAQTTAFNHLGIKAGDREEEFTLIAPKDPGIYEVRFRAVEKLSEQDAFDSWRDESGNEPDASKTIGLVIVK